MIRKNSLVQIGQQSNNWISNYENLYFHMASLGHSELTADYLKPDKAKVQCSSAYISSESWAMKCSRREIKKDARMCEPKQWI